MKKKKYTRKNRITPLWNRMGSVFQYGFKKDPLILAISCGFVIMLAAIASAVSIFVGVFFLLFGILYPYKYAYTVLEQTAAANMEPPPMMGEHAIKVGYDVPLKQLGIIIVLLVFTYILADFNTTISGIFLYSGLLLLPASIMTMGMTHSFTSAINPQILIEVIRRVGFSYLALIGLIVMMYNIKAKIIGLIVVKSKASFLFITLFGAIDIYFTVIIFHMMGYFLYQFHEALGETAHYDEEAIAKREGKSLHSGVSPLFDQFMQQGNSVAALAELKAVIANDPKNQELQKRLQTMLVLTGATVEAEQQNNLQLPDLLTAGQYNEAADTYVQLLQQGELMPEIKDEKAFLPLAKALRKKGKAREIVKLLKVFHQNFPSSQEKPAYFLFAAKALSEDLDRDDKALQLLNAILKAYPHHALIDEIKTYKKLITDLGI